MSSEIGRPGSGNFDAEPNPEREKIEALKIIVDRRMGKPLERDMERHRIKMERYTAEVLEVAQNEHLGIPDLAGIQNITSEEDRLILCASSDLKKVEQNRDCQAAMEMIRTIVDNGMYNIKMVLSDEDILKFAQIIVLYSIIDEKIKAGWNCDETAEPSEIKSILGESVRDILRQYADEVDPPFALSADDVLLALDNDGDTEFPTTWQKCSDSQKEQIMNAMNEVAGQNPKIRVVIHPELEDVPEIIFDN